MYYKQSENLLDLVGINCIFKNFCIHKIKG